MMSRQDFSIPKLLFVGFCQLFCIFVSRQPLYAERPILFAPLPLVTKEVIRQQFSPMSHYLEEATGTSVELRYYANYQTLVGDMAADKIDLAYLGPLPYILLRQQHPDLVEIASFIDADGKTTYSCSLVHFDNDLNLNMLTGQQAIALPQPYSTCAYLMTDLFFKQRGMNLKDHKYYYAGNHAEAVLDVIRGKAAFAGVKTSIAERYRHLGIKITENDRQVPGLILVANPNTLPAETIEKNKKKVYWP